MDIKNNPLEYTGVIVKVGEREEFGDKGFAKRGVILSADPDAQYPRMLQVWLTTTKAEDKTNLITPRDAGKMAKVTAFVETRKWTSKTTGKSGFITEATAWKVEILSQGSTAPEPAEPTVDDMPF